MERFILRAEIHSSKDIVVSYGYDLTASSVFVVTDWYAPIDTPVSLRLSFPRILEPVDIAARVAEIRGAGAPGELAGLRLELDSGSEVARGRLAALLANIEAANGNVVERAAYRVLLVEDNGLTRDVFAYGASRFFGDASKVRVDHADSAERAWEQLAANDYDLVVVDYILPAADGASLIARLRADDRLAALPIVAMSIGGRDARDATMSAGADLFVDKPFAVRALFATLRVLAYAAPVAAARHTILVLDDSPLALAVTRAALEQAGFAVAIADNLTAFERLRARCVPDLILVDVQMPEAFGDDVAAMLLSHRGVQVPVVLFSSLDEAELRARAAEASATAYICKGAGMTELVRRCRELLERAA